MLSLRAAILFAILASVDSVDAQVTWTPLLDPSARTGHTTAYDFARRVVVLFGGSAVTSADNTTWTWNGKTWTFVRAAHNPAARVSQAMAYDSKRALTVMFGGFVCCGAGAWRNDTWEWNGNDWILRTPNVRPGGRSHAAMAYDATRQRLVLFGGFASSELGDTWEWDGSTWTPYNPPKSPPARMSHAMSYDPVRKRVVMFGGYRSGSVLRDMWEWTGSTWKEISANVPGARRDHRMACDTRRNRIVLFGGYDLRSVLDDTWEWDGGNWALRSPVTRPPGRTYHALSYDTARARTVLYSGSGKGLLYDVWEWDGSNWRRASRPPVPPMATGTACYDESRDRVTAFVSAIRQPQAETWEWNGAGWQRATGVGPPARTEQAMAYDPVRRRAVLFGGVSGTGPFLADTWDWDGSTWTQRAATANDPKPRGGAAMAFDRARAVAVMFGGYDVFVQGPGVRYTQFSDTYVSSGKGWTKLSPKTSPSARAGHAMAYDETRGYVLLFGGVSGDPPLNYRGDTWIWNGTDWKQLLPKHSPSPRSGHRLAYDAARQRIVLIGGATTLPKPDTWEWDGSDWKQLQLPVDPPARANFAMAYDRARGATLVFGGNLTDTWMLSPFDLVSSSSQVSLASGGRVDFAIDAGAASAGKFYFLLGCMDGSGPRGITIGNANLLLAPDAYFTLTATTPGLWIANSFGVLDAVGRAAARLTVPPGSPAGLAGLRLYHAYVTFQKQFEYGSSPVPLGLVR